MAGGRPAKTVQTVGLLMTYYKTTIRTSFDGRERGSVLFCYLVSKRQLSSTFFYPSTGR